MDSTIGLLDGGRREPNHYSVTNIFLGGAALLTLVALIGLAMNHRTHPVVISRSTGFTRPSSFFKSAWMRSRGMAGYKYKNSFMQSTRSPGSGASTFGRISQPRRPVMARPLVPVNYDFDKCFSCWNTCYDSSVSSPKQCAINCGHGDCELKRDCVNMCQYACQEDTTSCTSEVIECMDYECIPAGWTWVD